MWAQKILDTLTNDLKQIGLDDAYSGNLGERFSCVIGQRYLIDVVLVNPEKAPEVGVILDITDPGDNFVHNIFDVPTSAEGLKRTGYVVNSINDAMMRIASAVSLHTDDKI